MQECESLKSEPESAWSLVSYELGVLRTIWKSFGLRKVLKFLIYLPIALVMGNNRFGYEKIAPCETRINGMKVVLPHPDAGFLQEIIFDKCYTKQLGFDIHPGDIVVDLGANVGIFTIMASLAAGRGRVIAIEAEAHNYDFLCENIRANRLSNVETQRMAVSDRGGFVELHLSGAGSSSIVPALVEVHGTQEVESISMDKMFSRFNLDRVDFLKMDVEGAEFGIFKDAEWLNHVTKISMEVHPRAGEVGMICESLIRKNFDFKVTRGRDGLLYLNAKRAVSPNS